MKIFKNNPTKPNLKTETIPLLALVAMAISIPFFYSKFPELVPIHWDFKGNPDDWGSKVFAAFLIPLITLGIYLMFLLIPYFDPRQDQYKKFLKTYHIFKNLMVLFLVLIYFVASLNAIGYNIRVEAITPMLVGVIFVVIGNYMGKIKNNWFMGIRTPWTLSSEDNWNKTHRFGGKVYVLGGLLMIILNFLPEIAHTTVFVVNILAIAFLPIIYSLLLYIKSKK